MKFHMINLLFRNNLILTAAQSPGDIFKNVMGDFKTWLLAGMGVYAAVQFILGCMDFMSKEPQKHSAGKDHMVHAGIGLVLAFSATTIMTYLQTQTGTWSNTPAAMVEFNLMLQSIMMK